MKTFVAKPETVKRDWYVVDAEGKTLGRLASEIASRYVANTKLNTLRTLTLVITSSLLTLRKLL
ncbi:LSU ribosomal protein L13p [Vibrio maritimus]|uniref:LSU ribosomal protein L13p n=1 Tax=Vibrio maritimus TaxID=990268 RepID=A0A090TAL4_9VIBR|nr:LSU ribosomal protein L13p [Vibrio maritimus]